VQDLFVDAAGETVSQIVHPRSHCNSQAERLANARPAFTSMDVTGSPASKALNMLHHSGPVQRETAAPARPYSRQPLCQLSDHYSMIFVIYYCR